MLQQHADPILTYNGTLVDKETGTNLNGYSIFKITYLNENKYMIGNNVSYNPQRGEYTGDWVCIQSKLIPHLPTSATELDGITDGISPTGGAGVLHGNSSAITNISQYINPATGSVNTAGAQIASHGGLITAGKGTLKGENIIVVGDSVSMPNLPIKEKAVTGELYIDDSGFVKLQP
jgi:hypothetical protein